MQGAVPPVPLAVMVTALGVAHLVPRSLLTFCVGAGAGARGGWGPGQRGQELTLVPAEEGGAAAGVVEGGVWVRVAGASVEAVAGLGGLAVEASEAGGTVALEDPLPGLLAPAPALALQTRTVVVLQVSTV